MAPGGELRKAPRTGVEEFTVFLRRGIKKMLTVKR
jgi:hypothetical protein